MDRYIVYANGRPHRFDTLAEVFRAGLPDSATFYIGFYGDQWTRARYADARVIFSEFGEEFLAEFMGASERERARALQQVYCTD